MARIIKINRICSALQLLQLLVLTSSGANYSKMSNKMVVDNFQQLSALLKFQWVGIKRLTIKIINYLGIQSHK
jgi:hypothetical protein